VIKAYGSQATDQQRDALTAAGVNAKHVYEDTVSGKRDDRPGLSACLKTLREKDTLVVWKLDRLGRDLRHLVNTVHELTSRGVGFKVLTGHGATIDTTTASGKLVFGFFAALAGELLNSSIFGLSRTGGLLKSNSLKIGRTGGHETDGTFFVGTSDRVGAGDPQGPLASLATDGRTGPRGAGDGGS
jgi:hypothetical protein